MGSVSFRIGLYLLGILWIACHSPGLDCIWIIGRLSQYWSLQDDARIALLENGSLQRKMRQSETDSEAAPQHSSKAEKSP